MDIFTLLLIAFAARVYGYIMAKFINVIAKSTMTPMATQFGKLWNAKMLKETIVVSLKCWFVLVCCLLPAFLLMNMSGTSREAEEARLAGDKDVMKKEFTDWLSQAAVQPQQQDIDLEFRNLKEFHRCKALEDVDEAAFREIVENMAKVMEISENRKEEIHLARHSRSMVNVIEDFEHGTKGYYTFGKYQTLKRPNNNMDIVFAIHAFKWELEEEVGTAEEEARNVEEGARTVDEGVGAKEVAQLVPWVRTVNMRERAQWKTQFRNVAMKLFEADCPQQLVTEMRLAERRKETHEKTQKDKDMRRKVERMYEQVHRDADKEKIRQEQGSWRERTGEKGGWGKIF